MLLKFWLETELSTLLQVYARKYQIYHNYPHQDTVSNSSLPRPITLLLPSLATALRSEFSSTESRA